MLNIVNPTDRDYARHTWILNFGCVGTTFLMIWANGIEDAIEIAADWLATNAPGHIMAEWSDEHKDLIREVCEERGIAFPEGFEALCKDARDGVSEDAWQICEEAEADLTRTESGFLTSYEWGIWAEDPERSEVLELVERLGGSRYR